MAILNPEGRKTPPRAVGRSGTYIQQLSGYKAFIPAPLPPVPAVDMSGKSSNFSRRLIWLWAAWTDRFKSCPIPILFVYMYVRKEAVLSSQIEGTQSSLQDLLAAEAKILSPDRPQDVGEVVNYVAAMNLGIERLKDLPFRCVSFVKFMSD